MYPILQGTEETWSNLSKILLNVAKRNQVQQSNENHHESMIWLSLNGLLVFCTIRYNHLSRKIIESVFCFFLTHSTSHTFRGLSERILWTHLKNSFDNKFPTISNYLSWYSLEIIKFVMASTSTSTDHFVFFYIYNYIAMWIIEFF